MQAFLLPVETRNGILRMLEDLTFDGRVAARDMAPLRNVLLQLHPAPAPEEPAPEPAAETAPASA